MNASCVCLATCKCVFETCVNLKIEKNDIKRYNKLISAAIIYEHVRLATLLYSVFSSKDMTHKESEMP